MSRIRLRRGGAAAAMSRRSFMGLVGVGAAALPFLRLLRAKARPAMPRRLLIFFSPNGTVADAWTPAGGETDFRLGEILEPLEPHRNSLLILQGLDMRMDGGPGDGHQKGMGWMLTGRQLLPGDSGGSCAGCPGVSWAGGISIDQYVADAIGGDTPFRSLELGAATGDNEVRTRMSYRGAADPLPPDDNPYAAFDRIFGGVHAAGTGPSPEQLRRVAVRTSVLDFVKDDYAALSAELVGDDRAGLERHLTLVREIEQRLTTPAELAPACVVPEPGAMLDVHANDNYPVVGTLQLDMLVAALACDLTRVGSMQWNRSVGNIEMTWLGIDAGHHTISHEHDSNLEARDRLVRINRWYAERFAYLIEGLKAVPEGDGSMLDNTLILWCNELGKGNNHSRNDVPFVLAGNLDGRLRTGRFLRYDRSHTDLYVSLANAFGIDTDTFGDPQKCGGPLPDLT